MVPPRPIDPLENTNMRNKPSGSYDNKPVLEAYVEKGTDPKSDPDRVLQSNPPPKATMKK